MAETTTSTTVSNSTINNDLSTSKTIRDYFKSLDLKDKIVQIKDGTNRTLVTNIDFIWDGTNYLMAYSTVQKNSSNAYVQSENITIKAVTECLPILVGTLSAIEKIT